MDGWRQNGQEIERGESYEIGQQEQLISNRSYMIIMGAMLLYGFILNTLILSYVTTHVVTLRINTLALILGYFVSIIAGRLMMRSKNIPLMIIGYSLVVLPLGFIVALLCVTYEIASPGIVRNVFMLTAAITGVMVILATAFTEFFERMYAKFLPAIAITLLITIVVEIIGAIFRFGFGFTDYIVVAIFMAFVGFDWAKAMNQERTVRNAVYSACELYVDIVNIFVRLLSIMSRSRRNS